MPNLLDIGAAADLRNTFKFLENLRRSFVVSVEQSCLAHDVSEAVEVQIDIAFLGNLDTRANSVFIVFKTDGARCVYIDVEVRLEICRVHFALFVPIVRVSAIGTGKGHLLNLIWILRFCHIAEFLDYFSDSIQHVVHARGFRREYESLCLHCVLQLLLSFRSCYCGCRSFLNSTRDGSQLVKLTV